MGHDDLGRQDFRATPEPRVRRLTPPHVVGPAARSCAVPRGPRARLGAPVSTPVAWEELAGLGPARVPLLDLPERLAAAQDPWAKFAPAAKPLPKGWGRPA